MHTTTITMKMMLKVKEEEKNSKNWGDVNGY